MEGIDGATMEFTFTPDELNAIDKLKQLMKDHPNIHFQTDPSFLSKFLIFMDWDPQKTLNHMIEVYKFKFDNSDWYAQSGPSHLQHILDMEFRCILKKRDINGRAVLIYKLRNIQPKVNFIDVVQSDDMYLDCIMMEQETQLNGLSVIIDCKEIPFRLLQWLTPSNMQIGSRKSEIIPIKHWYIHLINTSLIFDTALALVMPFLTERIRKKLHFHKTDFHSLHAQIGKDCLPPEYGGSCEDAINFEHNQKYLQDREHLILHNLQYGYKV